MNDRIDILKGGNHVSFYIDEVRTLADGNRKSLGFLPQAAFVDQAYAGKLWVAVEVETRKLTGYLLFGGKFPILKIYQLCIYSKMRRQGIGATLLSELESFGEKKNFQLISARVASDLPSNRFWDNSGYNIVAQDPGGRTTNRTLNIRQKELRTPTLLRMMSCESDRLGRELKDVKYRIRPILSNDTYVLDLNVYFDLIKKRIHRVDAGRLISSSLNNEVRICVTPEFRAELKRHTNDEKNDPILEFAMQLPTLPEIDSVELTKTVTELKASLFPDQNGNLSANSRSDLIHLAYCIHHRSTGFITREKAILSVSAQLQEMYLIEVLSAADLIGKGSRSKKLLGSDSVQLDSTVVNIQQYNENSRVEAEQFLIVQGARIENLHAIWHPGAVNTPRRRIIVRSSDRILAVASWDNPRSLNQHKFLHFFIDELFPQSERIIDHLLEMHLRDLKPSIPQMIYLETGYNQGKTLATALKRGYQSFPGNNELNQNILCKFALSGIITSKVWQKFKNDFTELTGLTLESNLPTFDQFINTGITLRTPNGKPLCCLNLFDFETLISPGIVLCPSRKGLIVPIKMRYADDLLSMPHKQMSLFASPEVRLHVERAYFRSPRHIKKFSRGTLALFYVSGNSCMAGRIAGCGRITYSDVISIDEASISLVRQGVLTRDALKQVADKRQRVHAFTFDNYIPIPIPIDFARLKTEKIISDANLVTAEMLTHRNLLKLMNWGFFTEGDRHA